MQVQNDLNYELTNSNGKLTVLVQKILNSGFTKRELQELRNFLDEKLN